MMKRLLAALVIGLLLGGVLVQTQSTIGNFTQLLLGGVAGTGTVDITTGTSSPESVVTGTVGDLFLRTDGGIGSTLYVKQSGSGNTGWSGVGRLEKLWLPAAYCQNATALSLWSLPATNPAVAACDSGTNTQKGVLDFADGANALSAQTQWHLPADFTSTVDVRIYWYSATTTNNVVWQVATICIADAETGDPAFNAASTVTDTAKGSANQYNVASIASLTTTGCAAGELMNLKVFRDPANVSDTHAATARLVGLELTYRRAQ